MASNSERVNASMKIGSHDRVWPLLTTLVVVGILSFWAIYSAIHSRTQSAVTVNADSVEPHTMAAVLAAGKKLHPVRVRRPEGPPPVILREGKSRSVTASCTTCHSSRDPDPRHGQSVELDEFHQDLVFDHGAGKLSCLSCHNSEDYDSLRAADGRSISYADVMQLCAQCHSKQHTDYQNGAHGGMTGHWDLSRGSRTRHNCIDCHDPHSPAFPRMQPTFKPIDRGLGTNGAGEHK